MGAGCRCRSGVHSGTLNELKPTRGNHNLQGTSSLGDDSALGAELTGGRKRLSAPAFQERFGSSAISARSSKSLTRPVAEPRDLVRALHADRKWPIALRAWRAAARRVRQVSARGALLAGGDGVFSGAMGPLPVRVLKAIDRLVGRTVYRAFLRRHRRTRPPGDGVMPARVQKILVVRPGGIGDAVLFFPLLQALRCEFPDAQLDVLAERRNVGLFGSNDVVHRAWAYDRGYGRELLAVVRAGYDVVIDTEQSHFLSAIVAYLTGAPVRCGFDTQGRGGLFTHRVHYSDQVYEVHSFLSLFAALTGKRVSFDPERPFFPIAETHMEWARQLLAGDGAGARLAVVLPGASTPLRRWAPERYRAVVQWLIAQGLRVAIIGGPGDVEAAAAMSAGLDPRRIINLAGRTILPRTAAVIALADVYVSSDTGPLHIAYGIGTPTVHMFGSGILAKWAPAGSRYRAVHKALPCSPCTRYGYTPPCPYGVECMKRIEVEDVIPKLIEALAERHATATRRAPAP